MRLDGGKIKEVQVHLLLSSRAEMQKVIEAARQTTIPAAAVGPQPVAQQQPIIVQPMAAAVKPQPPVITSNSLSGILAQQMYQQHQMQILSQQQNMPLMTSTSVRHDNYSTIQKQQQQLLQMNPALNRMQMANENSNDSRDISDRKYSSDSYDRKRRDSRSRSKSRDRRRRSRSRGRRYRDRTRSRDRRRRRSRSRDRPYGGRDRTSSNRDRSRDRGRMRNRSHDKEDRKESGNEMGKPFDEQQKNVSVDAMSDRGGSEKNMITNVWESGNPGMGNNQYTGIMQNFSSVSVPYGSDDSNKPISLFTNIYNQPQSADNGSASAKQDSLSTQEVRQPINSFEPVMPMIPFGSRSDHSRMDSRSDIDNSDMVRCCVRITNIGNNTHYSAVRRFFSGLHIPNDGVKLINDQYGNRTGVAVVRFLRTEVAEQALRRNQQQLNGNAVNITIQTLQEYNAEEDSYRPPRGSYNDRNRGGDFGNNRGGGGYNRNMNDSMDDRFGGRNEGRNDRGMDRNDRYDRNNRGDDFYNRNDDRMSRNDKETRSGTDLSQKGSPPPHEIEDDDDEVLYVSDSNCNRELSSTLLVEDLPATVTEEDVGKLFEKYTVIQVILPKVTSKFHAYVKLGNAEEVQMALKDAYRIEYKPVFVSVCSEKIFERVIQDTGAETIVVKSNTIAGDTAADDMDLVDEDDEDQSKTAVNPRENSTDKSQANSNNEQTANEAQTNQKQYRTNVPLDNYQKQSNMNSGNRNFSSNNFQNQNQAPPIPSLIDLNVGGNKFAGNNGAANQNRFSNNMPAQQQQRTSFASRPDDIGTRWIFVKNLEYRTSDKDITNWFNEINLTVSRVFLLRNRRGQPSGDCFCEFSTFADAKASLEKSRTRLGSRTIHLNLSPRSYVVNALASVNIDIGAEEPVNQTDENDESVLEDNDDDDPDNDEEHIDENAEENTEEVTDDKESPDNVIEDEKDNIDDDDNDIDGDGDDKEEAIEGDAADADNADIKNPFRRGAAIDTVVIDGDGDDDVDNDNETETNDVTDGQTDVMYDQQRNMQNSIYGGDDANMMMPQGIRGNYMNPNYRNQSLNNQNNYDNRGNMGPMNMGNMNMGNMNMGNINMGQNNSMNLEGRIVTLTNVPYRADTVDILKFFSGYTLTTDDVIRRYNDAGQPTGDARVRFPTQIDARRAVETMNNNRIMNRNILLNIL